MDRTLRVVIVLCGVACFVLAACSAMGWITAGNPTGFGLAGFACWLASTL